MKFFSIVCFLLFASPPVFSQTVDMRALSLRRGYRAYHAPSLLMAAPAVVHKSSPEGRAAEQRQNIPPPSSEKEAIRELPPELSQGADAEKLRQTGVKIFQEKDEDKIMNFSVENPEFKKLNKKQQQDLLNRISFEQSQVR